MGIDRAEVIARMRGALQSGLTATRFIKDMKAKGLSYRRTQMLSDWRSVNQLETKKELFRYVRKDYLPSPRVMAAVSWQLSQEFMYKVRVQSRLSPGEPLTERFVNIMSDVPLTPGGVELAVIEEWAKWEKYQKEALETITPVTAIRRVPE